MPEDEEYAVSVIADRLAVQARRLEQVEVRGQRRADRRQRQPELRDRLAVQPELVSRDPLEDPDRPPRQLARARAAAAAWHDVHDHGVLAEVRGERGAMPEPA